MAWTKATMIAGFLLTFLTAVATAHASNLDEKVKALQDSIYKKPVMHLNVEKWRTYVRTQPRNYSMIVMFTALSPSVNCPICKPAYEEFVIVANSFRYAHADAKALYFALVDYEEAPNVFQQMNLNTAPVLYHFSAKLTAKKKPDQMDFQRHGFDADAMARFIHDITEINIRVLRPPNYAAPVIVLLLAMLVLGLLYMRRNNLEFLYNRTCWAVICVLIAFIFMSGQMWNHIRGPPFVMTNPNTRETSFIHGSTQYQLVAETYIVALMYAVITFGFVLMIDAASIVGTAEGGSNSRRGRSLLFTIPPNVLVWIGAGVVVVFFSFLLSIFRSKYQGYPYSFLFS